MFLSPFISPFSPPFSSPFSPLSFPIALTPFFQERERCLNCFPKTPFGYKQETTVLPNCRGNLGPDRSAQGCSVCPANYIIYYNEPFFYKFDLRESEHLIPRVECSDVHDKYTLYSVHCTVHCNTIKLHQIFTHQMCTSDAVVPSLGLPLNSRSGRMALLTIEKENIIFISILSI